VVVPVKLPVRFIELVADKSNLPDSFRTNDPLKSQLELPTVAIVPSVMRVSKSQRFSATMLIWLPSPC
jgi:hypothetical protein